MSYTAYLLDASIYIFRAYFSLPDKWHSPEGYSLNAVYGYGRFLLAFLSRHQPRYMAAAFDESLGTCFRNDIYPYYKSSRAYPDADLIFQLEACKALTELLGVTVYASQCYEADDILASWCHQTSQPVCIVSRDKDLAQLLHSEQCRLWDPIDNKCFDRLAVEQHFGVKPEQLIDYQALMGDPVDDVPGVPGIGKKTAAILLQRYHTLDQLLANLDDLAASSIRGAKSLAKKLTDYRHQLLMARQLVQLHNAVPMPKSVSDLSRRPVERAVVSEYLKEIGLPQLAKQLET
jgi:5'-3' exonuclease